MRVRDRNRGDAAQVSNPCDRIAVDEAHAVPQNVTAAILNQESTLADSELGFGSNAPNPWALRIESVAMGGSQVFQGYPLLPLQTDKLALIFAYRASFGRASGRGKLRTASYTDVGRHRSASAKRRRQ